MRPTIRHSLMAAALVGALAAAPLIAPANGATPAVAPTPVYSPAGVLSISTGATNVVELDTDLDGVADTDATNVVSLDTNLDGIPEDFQPLNEGPRCLLSDQADPASGKPAAGLLRFDGYVGTSTTNKASFSSASLGVAEKKSGVSCYEVDAVTQERLVLTLNPTGVAGDLGPLLATSAFLDVDLKQGARILATATLDGSTVGYYELRSGSTIGTTDPLPGGVTPDEIFSCSDAADSGPDSGPNDNCRWPISMPSWIGDDDIMFDSLTLEAIAGSFALDGGADGTVSTSTPPPAEFPESVQTASFFELVQESDGILDCDETTAAITGDGTSPGVVVKRLQNADPAQACELVPYTLRNGPQSAQFLKPLDSQESAQFVITLTWTLPATDPLPVPVTYVNYEQGNPDIALAWCPDPLFSGDTLVGIANPSTAPDQEPDLTGTQFSCLGSQNARVVNGDPDTVIVTEQVYAYGDIFLRK